MTLNLADLKKMRGSAETNLKKIAEAIAKQDERKSYTDEKIWGVTADKAGNGSAVIRFLPTHPEDDLPYVRTYSHGFQGPTGQWYIENCLTTLGKKDPVVDFVSENIVRDRPWDSLPEKDKTLARKYKRKQAYFFNVLIVDDPKNPENNGQVKVFKCGVKIYEFIKDKLNPQFDDIEPQDVFDPWVGCNFRFRMRRHEGYANFDKSTFDEPSPITEDDEKLLDILNNRYRLSQYTDDDKFKSYEELKARLDKVLGNSASVGSAEKTTLPEPEQRSKPSKTIVAEKEKVTEDDDDMEFFQSLVDDDEPVFNSDDEIPF